MTLRETYLNYFSNVSCHIYWIYQGHSERPFKHRKWLLSLTDCILKYDRLTLLIRSDVVNSSGTNASLHSGTQAWRIFVAQLILCRYMTELDNVYEMFSLDCKFSRHTSWLVPRVRVDLSVCFIPLECDRNTNLLPLLIYIRRYPTTHDALISWPWQSLFRHC